MPPREPDGPGPDRRSRTLRAEAAALAVVLALAVVVPPFAWAEAESEGEGAGPPGAPPIGFEEPGELAGEVETALEEVAPGVGEEEAEEAPPEEVGAPSPAPVATAPEVSAGGESGPAPGPPAPVEEAPPAAAPAPTYAPTEEAATPTYETVAPPPPEPVCGEAIVEPTASSPPEPKPGRLAGTVPGSTPAPSEAPAPEPTEAPEPAVSAPAPTPATVDRAGSLATHRLHTVAPGECLWSIAEGVLPAGASDARIGAEVHRLWRLNATRIGTGDPNLVMVGTVLRLR